jgi:sec-independent protein translocase protein TatC
MIKRKHNENRDKKELTIVGHLAELRKRLINCAFVFIVAVILTYNFAETVVRDIINIVPDVNFVFIAPAELLMSYIKISVVGGLVIAAPFLLIQLWLFVSPGLNNMERKYISVSLITGSLFFIIGVIFSYFIVLPTMIVFFIGFQIDEVQAMISFRNYLDFVINTLLAFGAIFELPIVMVLLTKFNLVQISFLKKNRKVFVLVIFIIAAILTPPDVISQILLGIPMLILFEIGIILSSLIKNKNNKTPS